MHFKWEEKYLIGIDSIDNQHKELVRIINKLTEAMGTGKANDILDPIFDELIKYTQYHFQLEDKLFDQHEYGNRVNHKNEHQQFIMELTDLHMQYFNGRTVAIQVAKFLREWLINHIMISDKAYVSHLKGKGVI